MDYFHRGITAQGSCRLGSALGSARVGCNGARSESAWLGPGSLDDNGGKQKQGSSARHMRQTKPSQMTTHRPRRRARQSEGSFASGHIQTPLVRACNLTARFVDESHRLGYHVSVESVPTLGQRSAKTNSCLLFRTSPQPRRLDLAHHTTHSIPLVLHALTIRLFYHHRPSPRSTLTTTQPHPFAHQHQARQSNSGWPSFLLVARPA